MIETYLGLVRSEEQEFSQVQGKFLEGSQSHTKMYAALMWKAVSLEDIQLEIFRLPKNVYLKTSVQVMVKHL